MAASGQGYLSLPGAAQEAMPASPGVQGLLVWPVSFILICIALAVLFERFEGPGRLKFSVAAGIVLLAVSSLYRLVWFAPFGDEDLNALWNYSLVPIGCGLVGYFLASGVRKWCSFGKTNQHKAV